MECFDLLGCLLVVEPPVIWAPWELSIAFGIHKRAIL